MNLLKSLALNLTDRTVSRTYEVFGARINPFIGGAGNQTGRTCVQKFGDATTTPPIIPGRSISKMDVFGVIVSFETSKNQFSWIQMVVLW